jgi:type III restriction enzyme
VRAFSKLPQAFGFAIDYTGAAMNLRSYYPDFVATDQDGVYWLMETKGQETPDVARKDAAATLWCENATKLTKIAWKYGEPSAGVRKGQFSHLEARLSARSRASW